MENTSKALLIAAGVLIAIILIAAAIRILGSAGDTINIGKNTGNEITSKATSIADAAIGLMGVKTNVGTPNENDGHQLGGSNNPDNNNEPTQNVSGIQGVGAGGNTTQTEASATWNDKVCAPKLGEGMTGIYWDNNGTEVAVTEANKANWYNYAEQIGTTENGGTSKWANAKTTDGSYWVWIPRYEYKIDSTNLTIDVKFIPLTQTTADTGYIIHPAFQDGSNNYYMNGEWDAEISGIWVAKYEMSHSEYEKSSSDSGTTWNTSSGANEVPVKIKIRAVSKPSVSSWRNISIGAMYTICQEYDNDLGFALNSHLMKNSEWGAVAYLTHSKYGRNKTKININACSSYITGAGSASASASSYAYDPSTFESTYSYTSNYGKLASSTGNIYGIYDLSGGAWEYTAGYITNGHSNLGNGSSFINETIRTTRRPEGYKTLSTKYETVYPYYESDISGDTSEDSSGHNYNAYRNLRTNQYGYGDALAETSSWNEDYAFFANSSYPFFIRGGAYFSEANAGEFCSSCDNGNAKPTVGFRAVLVVG